jgi:hypothetical protein
MKTYLRGRNSERGSALLAAMIVVVILSFAAAGILSYSLTTYRNSVRQAMLDQAKEVADSEMEYLYFTWHHEILYGVTPGNVATTLTGSPTSTTGYPGVYPASACAALITENLNPFSSNMQGWVISRTLAFINIPGTPDGGAKGIVPGTVQIGTNYFYIAETRATSSGSSVFGNVEFHSGRHFTYSSQSLFAFAVFYQGDLEIAAGGNMQITGPVSTNASVYMGSQSGYTLSLSDKAYYFGDYNGAPDPLSGETQRLQGSGALADPIYNPDPDPASVPPANQTGQRALQVVKLSSQASFIGGIDVAAAIANYPQAYTNPQGQVDPNEVYRAVIAPPPQDSTTHINFPEDPVVQASRMYNKAAIIVTINQTTPAATPTVDIGTAADPTLYTRLDPPSGGGPILSAVQVAKIVPTSSIRQPIVNKRELAAGAGSAAVNVNLTTVDVGGLNDVLATALPANPTTIGNGYNGVVYVYDKSLPAVNTTAANTLNAILLKNGATTPAANDSNGNPVGFSVVSNNGVYVQGDYNTTPITIAGDPTAHNPAAILGDAVTAVSDGWVPTNAGQPIANRVATQSAAKATDVGQSGVGWTGVNPATSGTTNGMTIQAAILTGNTPSTPNGTPSYNSGGVQNLVRMEEDWWSNGLTLTLDGSLGQLFVSDYFKGNYLGNSLNATLGDKVYVQPLVRTVQFDGKTFNNHPPAGTPVTTTFSRGDFFNW